MPAGRHVVHDLDTRPGPCAESSGELRSEGKPGRRTPRKKRIPTNLPTKTIHTTPVSMAPFPPKMVFDSPLKPGSKHPYGCDSKNMYQNGDPKTTCVTHTLFHFEPHLWNPPTNFTVSPMDSKWCDFWPLSIHTPNKVLQ